MNWFVIGLIIFQTLGGGWYIYKGSGWYGLLFMLYALTNVVLLMMEKEVSDGSESEGG